MSVYVDESLAMNQVTELDVAVVGAGFAGLYAVHQLRGLGFRVRAYDAAPEVGGVWYVNRYPGARCDVESLQYSFSFSPELEQEWRWTHRYAEGPEILAYLKHVADRFDLRRDISLNTRVDSASFDEESDRWTLRTRDGEHIVARHCIMATGGLSTTHVPAFEGLASFTGRCLHTGSWPQTPVDFTGRKVAVIGTGSSGIQAIPVLARQAQHLTVFQRTPNFTIPAHNGPLTDAADAAWKARYREHRARAKEIGTLYEFSDRGAMAATAEEREAEYERRWARGGVNFVHSYNDLMINQASNDTVADFVRAKIRSIVKDPLTAERLSPRDHPLGTKRICVDTDYWATYNRDNVRLVDLRADPIVRVTPQGIQTASELHAIDDIVMATGYDAITGTMLKIDVRGVGGQTLKDKWANGPCGYLGVSIAGFPNLFVVTGPGSPSVLVNMVIGIEQHIDWIASCLVHLRQHGHTRIDADADAELRWGEHVNEVAHSTLFPKANSWYVGANIPGKPRRFMLYVAKIGQYRRECDEVAAKGYVGFRLTRQGAEAVVAVG